MKHNIKWGLIFTLTLALIFSSTCFAFAASVGDQLTSPETGWQRFNSNDYTYFHYYGDYAAGGNPLCYKGDYVLFYNGGVDFKFSGTEIRLIACRYSGDSIDSYSNKINITIDGGTAHQINETFSEVANTNGEQTYLNMVYEKSGLNSGVHTVTISSPGYRTPAPEVHTVIDAVDIDATGSMIPYNVPTNLQATPGDSKVSLSWEKVDGATSYNVKRSTTKGGPYTNVATGVNDTKYTDLTVSNGTTYYYVVSAVTSSGEGPDSNEASATPQKAVSSSNAILDIRMDDGSTKEYRLTSDELSDFLTWYESRSRGESKAFYIFRVKGDVSPFSSIDNYIPFNKILSYDVKAYS